MYLLKILGEWGNKIGVFIVVDPIDIGTKETYNISVSNLAAGYNLVVHLIYIPLMMKIKKFQIQEKYIIFHQFYI